MKLLVLAMMFLTSLNSAIPFSFDNVAKSNQDVIINETGNKVQLRQKAIKKANNADDANIETTNVDYDLRYLYGGEKGYLNYNIWDLLPTENNSKDTSYKFLCAKPVGKNLYLYVYDNDNLNGNILNANFNISKSKVQKENSADFEEQFVTYSARFINSYGYKQRFMKFAIDNIVNLEEDVRLYIKSGTIEYQDNVYFDDYYHILSNINHELFFKVGSENDFMGEYFSDDYVKITNGYVNQQLVGNTPISGVANDRRDSFYIYDENYYYFFNTDKKIDELIQVQYDYEFLTYSATWNTGLLYSGVYNITQVACYPSDLSGNAEIIAYGPSKFVTNQKIDSVVETIKVERPWFFGWNQTKEYQQHSIIDLSLEGLNKIENKDDRKWFEDNMTDNGIKYRWAFKIVSSQRKAIQFGSAGSWFGDFVGFSKLESVSECHEVKQALIVWLKFRTNNQVFEFNVLDIPKDTSKTTIEYISYETLGDIILEKTINAWDWFKSIFTGVVRNIVPILISVAVIMIIVLCWPVLSSTMQLVGAGIKSANKKIENKSKKKKKGKTKKKGN